MNKKGKFTAKGKSILENKKISSLDEFFKSPENDTNKSAKNKNVIDKRERIHFLKISDILDNPYQPRKYFDKKALEELTESIKIRGVIQPIVVRDDEAGNIYLVAGERRLKASLDAGLEKIPAIYTEGNPLEISLIENLQRENLKPIEEAEAFRRMIDDFKYTQEQLAKVIGKGRTTITEILSLTKLPEAVKEKCRQADIPKRSLIEIAKLKSEEAMLKLFGRIQKYNLKSDQVRKLTRKKADSHTGTTLKDLKKLKSSLEKLDIRELTTEDYLKVIDEIKELKELIDQLLS